MGRTLHAVFLTSAMLLGACQPLSPKQNNYNPQPAVDCQKPISGAVPTSSGLPNSSQGLPNSGQGVPASGGGGYTPAGAATGLGSESFFSSLLTLTNAVISYDVEMKTILARCTGCHGNAGGVNLASYDSAKAAGTASLNSVKAKRMPPGGALTAAEIATFEQWAAGGFVKSPAGGSGGSSSGGGTSGVSSTGGAGTTAGTTAGGGQVGFPPATGAVIYEDHIAPLLASACQSCHTALANRATFDTYDDVRRSYVAILARVSLLVTDPKHMPKGKPSLDAATLQLLRTWQSLNFPVRNSGGAGGAGLTGGGQGATTGGAVKPPC